MIGKRIILCGPTASGKTFLRDKLEQRGFHFDVSYTSREPREGEINGVHYNFISKNEFEEKIKDNEFYEYVKYNENYYGTGLNEWNSSDCFIMETDGIKHIKLEDRKNSFVIYLNPEEAIRMNRMAKFRNWNISQINERIKIDREKFKDFHNYDLLIINSDVKLSY
jgi:guanylate kinase